MTCVGSGSAPPAERAVAADALGAIRRENKTLLTYAQTVPLAGSWLMGLGFIRGCPPLPQTGAGARVTKLEQREDEVESEHAQLER